MDNFKIAVWEKLRFSTKKGLLSTEQLCDLNVEELNDLAVELDEKNELLGKKKSFLTKASPNDKTLKLKLDIVVDILQTKLAQQQAESEAYAKKEHNEKIIALIAEKQDESLKGKSVEELQGMLK